MDALRLISNEPRGEAALLTFQAIGCSEAIEVFVGNEGVTVTKFDRTGNARIVLDEYYDELE